MTVLAAAGLLVPLNQARIHTTTSLFKQVDFGVWFAAAAAGFAIAHVFGAGRRVWLRAGAAFLAGTLAVVLAGTVGRTQASSFFREWPNSTQTMAELRYLTRDTSGKLSRRRLQRTSLLPGELHSLAALVADLDLYVPEPELAPAPDRRSGVPGGYR